MDAGLAVKDVRQELRIEAAEIGADLLDGLAIAKAAGQLCEDRKVHRGRRLRRFTHDRQAAFSPPGFIISCSTLSIEGRS